MSFTIYTEGLLLMEQETKSDVAFFKDLPAVARRAARIKDVNSALGIIQFVAKKASRFKNPDGRRFATRGPFLSMIRASGEASYYSFTRASNSEYRRLYIKEAESVVQEWDEYTLSPDYIEDKREPASRKDPRWNAGLEEAGYWTRSLYDELFESFAIGTKRDRLFSIEDPFEGTVHVNYNNRMLTHPRDKKSGEYYQALALNWINDRPDVEYLKVSRFFTPGYDRAGAKAIQSRIFAKTYDNYLRKTRSMTNQALLSHLKDPVPMMSINPIKPMYRDIQATKTEHPKTVNGQLTNYNHEVEVLLSFVGY